MKVGLFLLAAVPLVMAGLPRGMDMEDMYKMMMGGGGGGGGDDNHGRGDDNKSMEEMMKQMMEKKGWSEDDDKDHQDDYMKDMMKQMMEKKGWGEDDDKDHQDDYMKDMMKQMMEKKGWGGDNYDNDKSNHHFISWLKGRQQREQHEREEEEMRKYKEEFQKHLKMKMEKKEEMERMRKALYEQMQMIETKKNMTKNLHDVSMEFMKKKLLFTYGVTSHFLDFCQCDDSKDILNRMKEGHFGRVGYADDASKPMGHDEDMSDDPGKGMGGDKDGGVLSMAPKPTQEQLMEFVSHFVNLDHEEQVKKVLHDLVKVMCGAAKQFFGHLRQVEHYLIEYRKYHGDY